MGYGEILSKLKLLGDSGAVEGVARLGINPTNAYGASIPNLRALAKKIGRNHELTQNLWSSGIHGARILASMVADPKVVT